MVKLLAGHGADIEKRDRVSKEETMTSLLIDSVFFFFKSVEGFYVNLLFL